jgi:beta-xylosidase
MNELIQYIKENKIDYQCETFGYWDGVFSFKANDKFYAVEVDLREVNNDGHEFYVSDKVNTLFDDDGEPIELEKDELERLSKAIIIYYED